MKRNATDHPHYERASPINQLWPEWQEKIAEVREKSLEDLAQYRQAKVDLIKATTLQRDEEDEPELCAHLSHAQRLDRVKDLKEKVDKAYVHACNVRHIVAHRLEIRLATAFQNELGELIKESLAKEPKAKPFDPSMVSDFIDTLKNTPPTPIPDFFWNPKAPGRSALDAIYLDETFEQATNRRLERLAQWDAVADAQGEAPAQTIEYDDTVPPTKNFDPRHAIFGYVPKPSKSYKAASAPLDEIDYCALIWAKTIHPRLKETGPNPKMPHIHSVIEELMGDRVAAERITWNHLIDPTTPLSWEDITRSLGNQLSRE